MFNFKSDFNIITGCIYVICKNVELIKNLLPNYKNIIHKCKSSVAPKLERIKNYFPIAGSVHSANAS